jgi:hypothetical protein
LEGQDIVHYVGNRTMCSLPSHRHGDYVWELLECLI